MATCEHTTPARRNRTPKYKLIPPAPPPEDEPPTPLFIKSGNDFHEAPHSTVLNCARHLTRAQFRPGAPVLADVESMREFLMLQLGPREREVFGLILLDTRHRLIEYVDMFEGSVDGAQVYPREVIKCVVAKHAAAVVLVHNHPSGGCEPSLADMAVTARLKAALALIEVRVIDHLIVGESITSLAARGLV